MKLKDLIESNNTGLDAIKRAPIVDYDTGVRCLRIGDISNNRPFNEWGYTEVEDNNYNKFQLKKGDIIVARTGATIGVNKYIDKDYKSVYNNGLIRIRVKQENNPKYVYCLLQSTNYKNFIKTISMGTSTQPNMQMNDLLNLEVPDFDKPKQDKIVEILGKIDDKIELNNEINNNLFELLKQEFREKFYNKEEKDSYLIDYISETIGGDWGKENPEGNNNTKVYCVRGADIPSMEYGNKGNAPTRYILEKNYKNKKLDPNNIIIEISGGSPTQSTGRTAYITKSILDMYDSPLLCTNFCRAVEAKSDILAPFIYMNLKLMYEDDIFFNWENGTTGIKNLALNDMLHNLEVKSPDEMKLKDYYLLFNNVMNKISSNSNENIKLEQLRNTLLPKLMNGEIDLDNIEI